MQFFLLLHLIFFFFFFCSFLSFNCPRSIKTHITMVMIYVTNILHAQTKHCHSHAANILCHNWKLKMNTFLPDNTPEITKPTFCYLISQGTETTARWGGAAALWGDLSRPPAAGQRLLWKGAQASMFFRLFTSLSNFFLEQMRAVFLHICRNLIGLLSSRAKI